MKKYIHYSLILFIISIFLLSSVFGKDNLFLVGGIIVIDPGHGYLDPGTSYENIYEKDINLNISLYLKEKLESNGATVYMTRDGDYDLSTPNAIYRKKSDFDNRINLINNSNADIYLSIHLNYLSDFKYYGPQVFYNGKNIYFANIMQDVLNKGLNSNRKIKNIPKDTYMYSKLKVNGLLIECGFLSNYEDRQKLITNEYQKKVANLISNGVIKYFS
jgi:hypothetical protein